MGGEENLAFTTLWSNSFDDGNVAFTEPGDREATLGVSVDYAYGGSGYGCGAGSWGGWFRRYLASTRSDLIIMYRAKAIDTHSYARVYLDDGNYVAIQFDGQRWDAYVGAAKVADGNVVVGAEWHQVCVKFSIADAGSIQTWVDGVADINYSGDTQPDATDQISYYRMFSAPWGSGLYVYMDNVVVGYGDYPGELVPEWKAVNGDTATIDWTPTPGPTHSTALDEVPASSTDYIETATNALQDKLELANWTLTNKTIVAFVAKAMGLKTTADAQQFKLGFDSGGVEDLSAALDLLTTVKGFTHVTLVDPNTAAAWLEAGVNAAQLTVESVI